MRWWLLRARKSKELTQFDVAKDTGVSLVSYGNYETGKTTPRPENAKKIAKVLGFNWTRFYDKE